ncbi:MAG: hypothetical protein HDR88_09215 [Bacteroides sp.]|nr:hypothetical protein [Bacteroides sp.]
MEDGKDNDNIYIYSEEPSDVDRQTSTEESGLYNIEDVAGKYVDTSAPNFAQYSESGVSQNESENNQQDDHSSNIGGVAIFGLLLKTIFNPVEGWKSVRRHKITPEMAQKECFYPLLAVYAISKFAILAYSSSADLSEVIVDAVISFVSFFFGYFCILIVLKHIMPLKVSEQFETLFGKTLVVFSLSSLCLFFILTELLPMLWAVLIFLPLWTVYMICKAARFLKIPEDRHLLTLGVMNVVIVGMPTFLEYILTQILPN